MFLYESSDHFVDVNKMIMIDKFVLTDLLYLLVQEYVK